MAIYEIEKLKDELHVQDESPNPQIYALFKMGQELEQQGVGGGGGRTAINFNGKADFMNNVRTKLKTGDVISLHCPITVDGKTYQLAGQTFTYIVNNNYYGCAVIMAGTLLCIVGMINLSDNAIRISFAEFNTDTLELPKFTTKAMGSYPNSFNGTAFIYDNN